ncbi:MAG: lysophospholipid acyltransferase family protein [Chloroflexi bacterium]|nr:lysophospholipid acyltransferase family protein [Chloroflexota bacterium]
MIALYWLWRLGMFLTGIVPRRVSHAAAGWLGTAGYYAMGLRRRVAQNNFSHVLRTPPSDPNVQRVARESFRNYARLLRDVMIYPSMEYAEIERRVTIKTPQPLEAALAHGKGTILVSAHYGNMDLAAAVIATRYRPVALVSETLRPPQLMDFVVQMRRQHNIYMYDYDRAPRRVLEAMRRNEYVGMLMDIGMTHQFDMTAVEIDFFGSPTRFTAGPAQIALLTGAAIIVGVGYVDQNARVSVELAEPIYARPSGNRKRDLQVVMQQVGRQLEQFIRVKPEQWYMFRPMWDNGYPA